MSSRPSCRVYAFIFDRPMDHTMFYRDKSPLLHTIRMKSALPALPHVNIFESNGLERLLLLLFFHALFTLTE